MKIVMNQVEVEAVKKYFEEIEMVTEAISGRKEKLPEVKEVMEIEEKEFIKIINVSNIITSRARVITEILKPIVVQQYSEILMDVKRMKEIAKS